MSNVMIGSHNAGRLQTVSQMNCGFITRLAWSLGGRTLAIGHGGGAKLVRVRGEFELSGHTAPVKDVAFCPDARRIATASSDTTVRLWNVETGQPLDVLRYSTEAVGAVAFSASGQRLAFGGGNGLLRVVDLSGGDVFALDGHRGEINGIAFCGETLVSGSRDKSLRLWQGQQLLAVTPVSDWVRGVTASRDGLRAVAACKDGSIWVIDGQSGEVLQTWAAHDGGADSASFNFDGTLLATGGRDGTVKLWDISGEQAVLLAAHGGHNKPVLSVAFRPDMTLLASGGGDHLVRFWGVAGG